MQEILNTLIDQSFDSLVADLQDMVSIDSTLDEAAETPEAPFGPGIQRALQATVQKAEKLGLPAKNVDGYAAYAQLGDSGDLVAILAHVDVVPAVGAWKFPPFSAAIHDGKLYGRGSVDDKGPGMACLYALKAIRDSGLPISKRARLIWGSDEETLARGIYYYLDHEEAPACGFSPDAEFPIIHAEKGTIRFQFDLPGADENILSMEAGTRLNVVPDHARAVVRGVSRAETEKKLASLPSKADFTLTEREDGLEIEAHGVASHACYPEDGVNAIQALVQLLAAIFPDATTPIQRTVHALAEKLGAETNGWSAGLACSDEVSGNLTFNTAILRLDEKAGVIKFDIRYPVTHDGDELLERLKKLGAQTGGTFRLIQHKPPLYVEKDRPFIKMLQRAYTDCTGEEAHCISIGGGTYCRYVRNTVSFGPVFPGQKELAHQCDEYLTLSDLRRIAKIYAQAIYNLIE